MNLPAKLYKILFKDQFLNEQQSHQLNPGQLIQIENAVAVSNLVKEIEQVKIHLSNRQTTPLQKLDLLKTMNNSSAKLYNWNIVIECLNSMQFKHNITPDIKQHILMGDQPVIQEVLEDLFKNYCELLSLRPSSKRQRSTPPINQNMSLNESLSMNQKVIKVRNNSMHQEKSDGPMTGHSMNINKSYQTTSKVDLANISDQPSHATSPLEFFLSILQRRLQLNSKEATSLFADNNKYLAYIVAKGVQGIFEPIIQYYEEVIENVEKLVNLCDERTFTFTLQALKPGLISKSNEVAAITIKLYLNLHTVIDQYQFSHLQDQSYKWLIGLGGFQTLLLNLKRHPQLTDSLIPLIIAYSKLHFQEFFTQNIKELINNEADRIQFISSIFQALIQQNQIKQELQQLGIIDLWIDLVQQAQQSGDIKISCVRWLTCLIWRHYGEFIIDQRQSKVLQTLRSISKARQQNVIICSLNEVFQLFAYFSEIKSVNAPTIYKSIVILLIETFDIYVVRTFMLINLEQILMNQPNIPVSIIVEPLIKQILLLTTPCYVVLKFLLQITQRDLPTKSSLQILDSLAKLSLYDIIFYKMIKQLMIRLLKKGLNDENQLNIIEFSSKYAKVGLSIYFSSLKQQNLLKNIDIIQSQKRGQVIDILRSIIELYNKDLNQLLKNLICHTFLEVKEKLRSVNKGLQILLELFGDPEQIIGQYQQEIESTKTNQQGAIVLQSSINRGQIQGQSCSIPNISKLTKEQQYHLASLRKPPNADPKVIAQLEEAKLSFQQKVQSQADQAEQNSIIVARQKSTLRKQLEIRSIVQGVASKNKKDVLAKLIFPEGQKIIETRIIQLTDLNQEEDRDITMIEIILQRYNKLLRQIFNKFANSGFILNQPNSFEKLFKQTQSINISEILKILQEYELESRISKEEVIMIGRDLHVKLLDQRSDLKVFKFLDFQHLLVQISIILGERPPFQAKHTPPFQCMQQLINHFRQITASKNLNTALFDDPDTLYFAQQDMIKEFNRKLQSDPLYTLPQGYQKFSAPDLQFDYVLTKNLKIPESSRVAYEIVNSIIEQLGAQIIEPISRKITIVKARPIIFMGIQAKIQTPVKTSQKPSLLRHQSAPRSSPPQKKSRVLDVKPQRDLSLGLKMALTSFRLQDRAQAEQVANVIDDMVFAIENKRNNLHRSNHIINEVDALKQNLQTQNQKLLELQEKRRMNRQSELKRKLQKDRQENEEAITKLKKDKKINYDIEKVNQSNQSKNTKALLIEQKRKIENNQQIKQDNFVVISEHAKLLKIQELQRKKKEFILFNQKQIEQFNKEIDDQKERKVLLGIKKTNEENRKKQIYDKLRQDSQVTDIAHIQVDRQEKEQLNNKYNSIEYQEFFKSFNNQLKLLFDLLVKETFYPVGRPTTRDQIPMRTFIWFAHKFNIQPEILNNNDITTIFRNLTREKIIIDQVPVGMNYNEFKQAIHRISQKGKKIFDIIAKKQMKRCDFDQNKNNQVDNNQKLNKGKDIPTKIQQEYQNERGKRDQQQINELEKVEEDIQQKRNQHEEKIEKQENNKRFQDQPNLQPSTDLQAQNQEDIDQSANYSLQGLMQYLNLSDDKIKLEGRFRQILEEGQQHNKIRINLLNQRLQE